MIRIKRFNQDFFDLYNLKHEIKKKAEVVEEFVQHTEFNYKEEELIEIYEALVDFIEFTKLPEEEKEIRRKKGRIVKQFDL